MREKNIDWPDHFKTPFCFLLIDMRRKTTLIPGARVLRLFCFIGAGHILTRGGFSGSGI